MNKTRCPWCGKLVNKEADAEGYRKKYFYMYSKLSFGRHYGVCAHCGKIYNNVPRAALAGIVILLGVIAISAVFPILLCFVPILIIALVLISSRDTYFKRIDNNNSGVIGYDEKLRFKARVVKQYSDIGKADIFPLFESYDEKSPFSCVSPIWVENFDGKTGELRGYWLYEHCDNLYFASLDSVQLYDDEDKAVADITFKINK